MVGKHFLRHDLFLLVFSSIASFAFNQCSSPRNPMPSKKKAIKIEISEYAILYLPRSSARSEVCFSNSLIGEWPVGIFKYHMFLRTD